jgi:hypothetical protein
LPLPTHNHVQVSMASDVASGPSCVAVVVAPFGSVGGEHWGGCPPPDDQLLIWNQTHFIRALPQMHTAEPGTHPPYFDHARPAGQGLVPKFPPPGPVHQGGPPTPPPTYTAVHTAAKNTAFNQHHHPPTPARPLTSWAVPHSGGGCVPCCRGLGLMGCLKRKEGWGLGA